MLGENDRRAFCVMVIVAVLLCPVTVMAPVLCALVVLAETVIVTGVELQLPLLGVRVIHDALLAAVHPELLQEVSF